MSVSTGIIRTVPRRKIAGTKRRRDTAAIGRTPPGTGVRLGNHLAGETVTGVPHRNPKPGVPHQSKEQT